MNRTHKYDAAMDNQLRTLSHIGMFKEPLPKPPAEYTAFVDPLDSTADLTTRAKVYLQVNCAMCHVSDGGGNSLIELGYRTPFSRAHMIDEVPMHDTFDIPNARLIAPGDPERSVVYRRVSTRGSGQMPPTTPTSTNRVDEAGAKLLAEWIRTLARSAASN
jgi:mono/diheme cytochrome c family protein